MRVLVVGSGAREHALAWSLARSSRVTGVCVAPGNAGTAGVGRNLTVAASDTAALVAACRKERVDLVVVGPEAPLAAGLADALTEARIPVFGPSRAAARIEASKAFAKDLMTRHGIPTARGAAFDNVAEAERHIRRHGAPVVVKADGLAAGKGVVVAGTVDEAVAFARRCLEERAFGEAGLVVVVEEALRGREVSVFAFTDGELVSPIVAACDYKRLLDGDRGPNTGGMGAYSPPEFWDAGLAQRIQREIMDATVRALARDGAPYQGVLYGGLMLTPDGPRVLEFNCRLGDPETQVVLPRLKTDLLDLTEAVAHGRLSHVALEWRQEAAVGVVLASGGYPERAQTGVPVHGLDRVDPEALVFHAATRARDGQVVTDGGRVLTVVAMGPDVESARRRAYINAERIIFQGAQFRRDVGRLPRTEVAP